ncbi:AraC family transcriptional regulator [Kiritimatiellota bacterium B12222]|nr:AraC family transcriptional regulator [Kiritimatiellota bacterium B12222]
MNKTVFDAWKTLVDRAAETPLTFLAGWRAPVCQGVSCQVHAHASVEMVYHRKGGGVTRLGERQDQVVSFAEGSCVLYAPGLLHDQVMDEPGEDLCVHLALPMDFTRSLKGCLMVPDAAREISGDWDRLTAGRDAIDPLERQILNLRATTIFLELMQGVLSPTPTEQLSGKRPVSRAEEYIREHFARIESMWEVAEYAGLSRDRLRHVFKQQRGITLVAFMTQVKLERAKSLLVHSTLPLKQISTLCGFKDEFYFSNVFKRQVGVPPGAYRNNYTKPSARA